MRSEVEGAGPTLHGVVLVGAAVGAREVAEGRRSDAKLRESQRTLATLMDNLPGMAYRCRNDRDWTMEFVSEGALALTGYAPAELVGNMVVSYGQLIVPEDREPVDEQVQGAVRARGTFRMSYRIAARDGAEKWVWEQGCGVFSPNGELEALEGFITDITEAKRAEETARRLHAEQMARAIAEVSEQRARILSDASRVLGTSFDYRTTLASLARLTVPVLADYCLVDIFEDEAVVRLGVAHVDPAKECLLLELSHARARAVNVDHPLAGRRFQRQSTLVPEITPELLQINHADDANRAILEQLTPRSMIRVPIVVRDRVVGTLTLVMSESERRYTHDDLALAEELAHRAEMAVENCRLYHDAQEATQARDHVLAVVAHDLRNPLGAVAVASQLLLRSTAEGPARKHLELIRSSAEQMNRLIQDLLEVARIESRSLVLECQPQSVVPLIDEAIAMMRPLAAGRSIFLESAIEDELPQVMFDSARILQVISNLVGNAVKFTPEHGSIFLCCEREGGNVRFAVSDTGPGIPAAELSNIFTRFWQAASADRRGIGLGLSIAKGIVDAHGGTIWVESKEGVGSTFYFTLPLAELPE
jgi:PAS domain S-box-containing protein